MSVLLRWSLCVVLAAVALDRLAGADTSEYGVLNLESVFDQTKLVTKRSHQLQEANREIQQALASRNKEINRLKNELDVLPVTHPRYQEKNEAYQVKRLKFKLFQQRSQQRLQELESTLMKESYAELRALLKEFAEERGYLLIFLNPNPELNSQKAQEVRLEISLRPVVYYHSSLDITDDFIAFANLRYQDDGEPPAEEEDAPPEDEPPGEAGAEAGGAEEAPGFERTTPAEGE